MHFFRIKSRLNMKLFYLFLLFNKYTILHWMQLNYLTDISVFVNEYKYHFINKKLHIPCNFRCAGAYKIYNFSGSVHFWIALPPNSIGTNFITITIALWKIFTVIAWNGEMFLKWSYFYVLYCNNKMQFPYILLHSFLVLQKRTCFNLYF